MTLCINCNIAVSNNNQQFYYVLDMNPDIVSIIEEWIAHEVEDGNRVCQECFKLLMLELSNRYQGNFGHRQLGHQLACLCCGISIIRQTGRRTCPLHSGTAEHAYVSNLISPRQVPSNARICNACWQRAHYHALHNEPTEKVEVNLSESSSSPIPDFDSEPDPRTEFEPDPGTEFEPDPRTEQQLVILPGYSRTPDTASHCFVPECFNLERRRVPLYIRKKILRDCKIFVTNNARVCENHMNQCDFGFLSEYEFTVQFTPNQITKMLDLLRNKRT